MNSCKICVQAGKQRIKQKRNAECSKRGHEKTETRKENGDIFPVVDIHIKIPVMFIKIRQFKEYFPVCDHLCHPDIMDSVIGLRRHNIKKVDIKTNQTR